MSTLEDLLAVSDHEEEESQQSISPIQQHAHQLSHHNNINHLSDAEREASIKARQAEREKILGNLQHEHESSFDQSITSTNTNGSNQPSNSYQISTSSESDDQAWIDAMLASPVAVTASPDHIADQQSPSVFTFQDVNEQHHDESPSSVTLSLPQSASASAIVHLPRSWKDIRPMTQIEIMSIADPIRRAECIEQQKSLVGNRQMVEPLRIRRESMRTASVQNIVNLVSLQHTRVELERMRPTLGEPTSCAIHARWYAFGMSRGVVVLFDSNEQFVGQLGKLDDGRARGSVDCLDFNANGDVLLAGYLRGGCTLWDISGKSAVKDIKDASLRPITAAKFIRRDKLHFLAVDDSGVVTLFQIAKKLMWTVSRSVIVPGKAGRVLAISVLQPNPHFRHPSDDWPLIAICLETMSMVIALDPRQLDRAYSAARFPREEVRTGALPSVCWRSLQARDEDANQHTANSDREQLLVRHPVLVLARGDTVSYIQCQPFSRDEMQEQRPEVPLKFNHLGVCQVAGEVLACEWLGGAVLAAITQVPSTDPSTPHLRETHIRVIDPFEIDSQLEDLPLPQFSLVHHRFFPNPETGDIEPGADASVRAHDNALMLLGQSVVLLSRVLMWSDRVDALVQSGHWIDALGLALDFYQGLAKAAIGLPRDPQSLELALKDRVLDLLNEYVTVTLSGDRARDMAQIRLIGACAMEFCLAVNRLDILFTLIYAKFFAVDATSVLCELVEPYILNDRVRVLGPDVMPKFLEHYSADVSRLPRLEQCILHLDFSQLQPELDLLVDIARQARLVTALCDLNSRGKQNFGAAVADVCSLCIQGSGFGPREMLESAKTSRGQVDEDDDSFYDIPPMVINAQLPQLSRAEITAITYQLFLFIDFSFTGRAFPRGDDMPDRWFSGAKAQILATLFQHEATVICTATQVKSFHPPTLPAYPWLSFCLNVSARDTLAIIAQAFDAQDWTVYCSDAVIEAAPASIPIPEGETLPPDFMSSQYSDELPPEERRLSADNVPSRQDMLDALTYLIIDRAQAAPSSQQSHPCVYQPKNDDSQMLFTFAAKYLGKGSIQSSRSLNDRILENLTQPSDFPTDSAEFIRDRNQRESLLVGLLNRIGDQFDYELMLTRCQTARFYHVCVFLYKKRKDFVRILQYYIAGLQDCSNPEIRAKDDSSLFEFIASSIVEAKQQQNQQTFQSLRNALMERIPDLVQADADLTTKLIVQYFPADLERVIDGLSKKKAQQFAFLKPLMDAAMQASISRMSASKSLDSDAISDLKAQQSASTSGPEMYSLSLAELVERAGLVVSPKVHETYLALLCEFEPSTVLAHLQKHANFSLDVVLAMCQKYGIDDAAAYLLEKTGDVTGALDLMLKSITKRVSSLKQYIADHVADFDIAPSSAPLLSSPPAPSAMNRKSSDRASTLEASAGFLVCHRAVMESISTASSLCQRSGEGDKLWFRLLDCFVAMQRQSTMTNLQATKTFQQSIIGYIRTVLHSMMGYVTMPAMLRKIMTDHQDDELRDFRDMLVSMLDTYSYERNILLITSHLINSDQFWQIAQLAEKHRVAFHPRSDHCFACHLMFNEAGDSKIIIFDCLHTYHVSCLSNNQSINQKRCPRCHPHSGISNKSNLSHALQTNTKTNEEEFKSVHGEETKDPSSDDDIISQLSLLQKRSETTSATLSKFNSLISELDDPIDEPVLNDDHLDDENRRQSNAEDQMPVRRSAGLRGRGKAAQSINQSVNQSINQSIESQSSDKFIARLSPSVVLALRPRSLPSTLPTRASRQTVVRTVGMLPEIAAHENSIQL